MAAIRAKFPDEDLHPGDVIWLNDPYQGGTHLPDFYLAKPIFAGEPGRERRVGWSVSVGHQTDVGGKTPGGNGADATEIYQEGLRVPPVKLYERGRPVAVALRAARGERARAAAGARRRPGAGTPPA